MEAIVGLALGYLIYLMQTLDARIDKLTIEVERLKFHLPKRHGDDDVML